MGVKGLNIAYIRQTYDNIIKCSAGKLSRQAQPKFKSGKGLNLHISVNHLLGSCQAETVKNIKCTCVGKIECIYAKHTHLMENMANIENM